MTGSAADAGRSHPGDRSCARSSARRRVLTWPGAHGSCASR
jgi:hypothetical protein